MLYDYLKEVYGENEPIFISEIQYGNMSAASIRQQIKKLTDSGRLKRYDTGIYFIPGKSIFKSGSQLSRDRVIEKKYLFSDGMRCGYFSGVLFANQLGLTTQVPAIREVVTNRASNPYREVTLAAAPLILRSPRAEVTDENYRELQLMDLLADIDRYSEVDRKMQNQRILSHMRAYHLAFSDLAVYLPVYPDRIYRNMYEVGLMNGVSS